jgi:hypothetical protein
VDQVTAAVEALQRDPTQGHALVETLTLTQADGQVGAIQAADFTAIRQAGLLDQLPHL